MHELPIARLVVLLMMLVAWSPAAPAQPAAQGADPQALVAEIAALNRTLDQLVGLVRAGLTHQKIDVMLKRIELKERRLAPLEGRLRSAQDSLLNTQTEVARLQQIKDQAEQELLEHTREGDEPAMNESRYLISELEQAIEGEQARIDELERRVLQLEDDLVDGRDEIAILDEMLAELLE